MTTEAESSDSAAASSAATETEAKTSAAATETKTKAATRHPRTLRTFAQLIDHENERLDASRGSGRGKGHAAPVITEPGVTDEPWVRRTGRDLFGLALSGGGIRSATFNLGLLQALERKNLLAQADYVSTVSGGGYVGSFWTAWRHRHEKDSRKFPIQTDAPGQNIAKLQPEPPPVRHLREFSRFLMPRLGFLHMETWEGIVTVLGGLLPSLLTTTAVFAMAAYLWFGTGFALANLPGWWGAIAFAALTLLIQAVGEQLWVGAGHAGTSAYKRWNYAFLVAATALLAGALWIAGRDHGDAVGLPGWLFEVRHVWLSGRGYFGVDPGSRALAPVAPALVWLVVGAILLLGRGLFSRISGDRPDAGSLARTIDRVIARCLGPAVVWAGAAAVWAVAAWVHQRSQHTNATLLAGAGTATTGGLFVLLRDWLTKPQEETRAGTLLKKLAGLLRPFALQLLAAAAIVLHLVLVCILIHYRSLGPWLWWTAGACVAIMVSTLLFFDLARVGMHDFYRSRICRCFLGASHATRDNFDRRTTEQPGDDLPLRDIRAEDRPIHLVCCTANNIAGDSLGSLYRGARSAVLSRAGVSLGNYTGELAGLRLSSAATASAAAFNSQMGRISMDLGPAVALLMCSLNLRLGLWVPHPVNPSQRNRALPGLHFFREMFGLTRCDPLPPALVARLAGAGHDFAKLDFFTRQTLRANSLHLSDGGHFENLALYELIRRHCRYILVSDCGADPEVAFDDLAIALRTVREDFGVEIELDVRPLRPDPATGRARQHAVVGTVHYDGYAGTDKGTIVFFKPVLTGDEPPDVLQYQTRNAAFPHETTGDQFYDEAQWESYRRLGDHAGEVVFRYLEKYAAAATPPARFVENAFLEAAQRWLPAPDRHTEARTIVDGRLDEIRRTICNEAPPSLRAEFFPEVAAALAPAGGAGPDAAKPAEPAPDADAEVRTVHCLMLVSLAMEDVWSAADLDRNWSHPVNEAWMNYTQRWASTASFRRWWPVLRPIHSNGFRDFVRDRYRIRVQDPVARPGVAGGGTQLGLCVVPAGELAAFATGFAWQRWLQRQPPDALAASDIVFEYNLTLESAPAGWRTHALQAGFLLANTTEAGASITWPIGQLFVPHTLIGSGIVARLLDAAIAEFRRQAVAAGRPLRLDVVLDTVAAASERRLRPDPGERLQRIRDVNFYKSRGFELRPATDKDPRELLQLTVDPS